MKFSFLYSAFDLLEHMGGQLSNLRGSVSVGSEPHTDETIKQAAVDWCTGGDARDAVIAKHGAMKDWDVSAVTNMAKLFNGYGDKDGNDIFRTCVLYVEDWDVSSVTDMSDMFQYAEGFNGDLTNFDTSSVTDMSWMFAFAKAFNGDLTNWDTSSVTDMNGMFAYAKAFNGDLTNFDTSSVTNMRFMFSSAEAFNGDLTNFDTSSVTDMSYMFSSAHAFKGDGLSNWVTYLVHDMSYMFYLAEAFNADISQWDVSDCTDFTDFLLDATSFDNNLCDAGASPSWQSSGYCN